MGPVLFPAGPGSRARFGADGCRDYPVGVTEPTEDLPDQMRVRHEKRARLLDSGMPPYPVSVPRTHTLAEVRAGWAHLETGEETQDEVGVAGRVIFVRNTGKLCFATLQEGRGTRLQVMLSLAEVGEDSLEAWKHLVDLGDHVFVRGRVISSRRGELSVMAAEWSMAAKALRPLPVLHKELSEESRVRQRYADLIVRQEARDMVRTRAAIVRAVRHTLEERGYLEIETPILQLIHGGARARPFTTHMNAFDQQMTLRIALELNLKKAVVGGVDKVFEIGRNFRNEGVDSTHSPEFTMLEAYEAYGDQHTMAELTRAMVLAAADAVGSRVVQTPLGEVDLSGEWRWLRVYDGVSEAVGETVTPDTDVATLRAILDRHQLEHDPAWDAEKLVLELLSELVEPDLAPAHLRLRLPAVGPAAGPAAPGGPAADRGLGPDHRRGRAGHGVQRAGRPGDPARRAHRAVPPGGRRGRRGDAAGRGLPAGPGVRRAADGRDGDGHRPARHAVHRGRHPRDHPLPAPEARSAPLSRERSQPTRTVAPASPHGVTSRVDSLPEGSTACQA